MHHLSNCQPCAKITVDILVNMYYSVPIKEHAIQYSSGVRTIDPVELLLRFGLTRQEATIYLELMLHASLTGYEVAKHTGISRSNAYSALAALVDKGAAYLIEGTPVRYTAVECKEFCANILRSLEEAAQNLEQSLPSACEQTEGYITICGKTHIYNKLVNMLDETELRLYIAARTELLERVRKQLEGAVARDVKVVIIADSPFELSGATIYVNKQRRVQVRLITDSSKVLTGEFDSFAKCSCLYSEKAALVDLIKDSLKDEITLITMQAD